MKSIIARKTIIPIFLTFIVLIGLLFVFNYRYINNLIQNDEKDELSQMACLMLDEIDRIQANDDETFMNSFVRLSKTFCSSFEVDYICMFEPNLANNTVSYDSIEYNPNYGKDTSETDNLLLSQPSAYTLKSNELSVLNGESEFVITTYENRYDYSLSAVIMAELPSGTRKLISIEKEYNGINSQINKVVRIQAEYILFVFMLVCFIFYMVIRKYVSKPAGIVSKAMQSFVSNGHQNFTKMDETRNDEFGLINKSFNKMVAELDDYVENLSQQKAQIDIASKIQKGLLPKEKSIYNGCRISAFMAPAKEIGGDFYEYLELDEDNTLVAIADVSGKGVSAAVFMAATLILLRQFAHLKMSPKKILENINNELTKKNPQMLFVTAVVGIYNRQEKKLIYSNAGHNNPYIISSGTVRMLENAKGTILGLFENESFSEESVSLQPGETLFMYTDGVNEAVNKNKEFLGIEKLEKKLSEYSPDCGDGVVNFIKGTLSEFSEGAEQYDDITMLALTAEDQIEVRLKPENSDFEKIKQSILSSSIPQALKLPLCLASEEIFVNICSYAFEDISSEKQVVFRLKTSDRIEISFEDNGIPYNPTISDLTEVESYDTDNQTGGLGKVIAFGIADDVLYEYKDGKNRLTLLKYREINK